MTKDNNNLIERCIKHIIPAIIVFVFILTYQTIVYNFDNLTLGNSTQEDINNFKSRCDEIFGKNNWSIYGADWIDFVPYSNHPLYLQNTHRFTCFLNGTVP